MINTTENQIEGQNSVSRPAARPLWPIGIAWIATLLLSKLPLVVARDILGTDIPWIIPGWIGTALLFLAATYIWSMLKPLRSYFFIMAVIVLMSFGFDPFIHRTAAWQSLLSGRSVMVILFAERVLLALETLVVVSILLLTGVKRKEAFLAIGNLKAPVGGLSNPTWQRRLRWPIFGPAMAILLGGLFSLFLASQDPGGIPLVTTVLPWLSLILFSAMLNAFSEEVTYRALPLSTLLPATGSGHALWLTSLWFGLGHYYGGIPSGPIGLFQTGLLALLLGKAMLDTRGLGWSWIIHAVLDTVIYFFIAATTS